jgi:hypothetical protein
MQRPKFRPLVLEEAAAQLVPLFAILPADLCETQIIRGRFVVQRGQDFTRDKRRNLPRSILHKQSGEVLEALGIITVQFQFQQGQRDRGLFGGARRDRGPQRRGRDARD